MFYNEKNVLLENKDINKNLLSVSESYFKNNLISYVNSDIIKKINILQKIGYKIDIDLFIYIFYDNDMSIQKFLEKNRFNINISFNPNTDSFKQYFYKKYIFNNENINQDINNLTNNEKIKYKNLFKKNFFYHNKLSKILENYDKKKENFFKMTLQEIDVFKYLYYYFKYKDKNYIYHYILLDYRLRHYFQGNINFVQSKFIRFFIKLNNNLICKIKSNIDYTNYFIASQIKTVFSMNEGVQLYNID